MKVLILIPSLSGGGAEFVAGSWARYLTEKSVEVTVGLTSPSSKDPELSGISVRKGLGRGFVAQVLGTRRLIAETRPDVVLALMPHWNLLAIIAARLTPRTNRPAVVISGRNMAAPLQSVFGLGFRVQQFLARRLYRFADEFVAISHAVGAEALAAYKLSSSRVSVVRNPALTKVSERGGGNKDLSRDESGIDIVVPGRLVPQKRPQLVLAAAELVRQQTGGRVTVHFFGEGPLQAALAEEGDRIDVDVVFHGWVSDWFNHCPQGSVAVLASLSEGFGNVFVEAAAVGVPSVVTSRCFGASDAVVPGLTGELIRDDQATNYAEAILSWSGRRVSGVDDWLQKFSFEESGESIESVLRTVIANR